MSHVVGAAALNKKVKQEYPGRSINNDFQQFKLYSMVTVDVGDSDFVSSIRHQRWCILTECSIGCSCYNDSVFQWIYNLMDFHSNLLKWKKKFLISKIITCCKINQLDDRFVVDIQGTIDNNFAIH